MKPLRIRVTAKEKASDLIAKHYGIKAAAKITVFEIIEALEAFGCAMYDDFETGITVTTGTIDPCEYWSQVNLEIDKL